MKLKIVQGLGIAAFDFAGLLVWGYKWGGQ